MDLAVLEARRATVIARHELLESVPGSGWHPDDPPRRDARGSDVVPLSQRPTQIDVDTVGYFVGPDVPVVRAALAAYAARPGNEDDLPMIVQTRAIAKRLAEEDGPAIVMPGSDRNNVCLALAEEGIRIVSAGLR